MAAVRTGSIVSLIVSMVLLGAFACYRGSPWARTHCLCLRWRWARWASAWSAWPYGSGAGDGARDSRRVSRPGNAVADERWGARLQRLREARGW